MLGIIITIFSTDLRPSQTAVQFGLRIDVNEADYDNLATLRTTDVVEFQSIFAVFDGLTIGAHAVQMYAKTNSRSSSGVVIDPCGYYAKIISKETY